MVGMQNKLPWMDDWTVNECDLCDERCVVSHSSKQ